jgi:hypothetical protein
MFFIIAHQTARERAIEAVKDADDGWCVRITPPNRNLEQNAKFHALCCDASKHLLFMGKKRTPEEWKFLFCSGHAQATKQGYEIVPGLEGEWCNIRESTAAMSKARMSSLIEYTTAYITMQGVNVS